MRHRPPIRWITLLDGRIPGLTVNAAYTLVPGSLRFVKQFADPETQAWTGWEYELTAPWNGKSGEAKLVRNLGPSEPPHLGGSTGDFMDRPQ